MPAPAKDARLPAATEPGTPDFVPFVKAVGRGAKLRRDLTEAEAALAIQLIGHGVATPGQAGKKAQPQQPPKH